MFNINIHIYKQFYQSIYTEKESEQSYEVVEWDGDDVDVVFYGHCQQKNWFRC